MEVAMAQTQSLVPYPSLPRHHIHSVEASLCKITVVFSPNVVERCLKLFQTYGTCCYSLYFYLSANLLLSHKATVHLNFTTNLANWYASAIQSKSWNYFIDMQMLKCSLPTLQLAEWVTSQLCSTEHTIHLYIFCTTNTFIHFGRKPN